MKSDICWEVNYYVSVKNCLVGMLYHHEEPTYWRAYIRASDEATFQLLFDGLTKAEIPLNISKERNLEIDIVISLPTEKGYLGGYLPEKYENLLEKLRTLVYELIEKERDKGEEKNG